MSGQLHLPDLPEVAVGVPKRRSVAWGTWMRELFGASLPLLLMALLALGTWWLVKNAPRGSRQAEAKEAQHLPDYRLEGFTLKRYNPNGQLAVTLQGERLKHFPDDDSLEIDTLNLEALGIDGRRTVAVARQAQVSRGGSLVVLKGSAHITSQTPGSPPVEFTGEQLHLDVDKRRVWAEQPVRVRQGLSEFSADAFEFDEGTRQLQLTGPARAVFAPQSATRR